MVSQMSKYASKYKLSRRDGWVVKKGQKSVYVVIECLQLLGPIETIKPMSTQAPALTQTKKGVENALICVRSE